MELNDLIVTDFSSLKVIERTGNRVTFGDFVFLTERGFVHVKRMVIELPPKNSVKIERPEVDEQGTTFTATALAPRIVSIEWGG
jgi:hypothetical protein